MIKNIRQAVILAGGRGIRLAPFTDTNPKPMIPINDRPFLEYLVELLKENDIKEIVMLLGYLPEKIMDHFGDGSRFGLAVKYSVSEPTDETGMRLKKAVSLLDEHFLLMNCDTYWPLNLKKFLEFYNQKKVLASVAVYNNNYGWIPKNNVLFGEDGFLKKYDKTKSDSNLNGVEAGSWIMSKEIVDEFSDENLPFAEEVQPILASKNQLSAYVINHHFYNIDSYKLASLTEKFLKPKKIVFLDRDGVLNKQRGDDNNPDYVKSWEEFEFLPGAIEAIKMLTERNYEVFIFTNQQGISRGLMTEDDLRDINEKMKAEIKKGGGEIKEVYHCPHGKDDNCECRKPKPGMLFQASRDWHLDLTKAILVGDGKSDIQAGEAAGCQTILLNPNQSLLMVVENLP